MMELWELFEHEVYEAERAGLHVRRIRISSLAMQGMIVVTAMTIEQVRQHDDATVGISRRLKPETASWREILMHPADYQTIARTAPEGYVGLDIGRRRLRRLRGIEVLA